MAKRKAKRATKLAKSKSTGTTKRKSTTRGKSRRNPMGIDKVSMVRGNPMGIDKVPTLI